MEITPDQLIDEFKELLFSHWIAERRMRQMAMDHDQTRRRIAELIEKAEYDEARGDHIVWRDDLSRVLDGAE